MARRAALLPRQFVSPRERSLRTHPTHAMPQATDKIQALVSGKMDAEDLEGLDEVSPRSASQCRTGTQPRRCAAHGHCAAAWKH